MARLRGSRGDVSNQNTKRIKPVPWIERAKILLGVLTYLRCGRLKQIYLDEGQGF